MMERSRKYLYRHNPKKKKKEEGYGLILIPYFTFQKIQPHK